MRALHGTQHQAPCTSTPHFLVGFHMYASSLSFSYLTVLRNRLSARYVRRSPSFICIDQMLDFIDHIFEGPLELALGGHFLVQHFDDGEQIATECDFGAAGRLDRAHR